MVSGIGGCSVCELLTVTHLSCRPAVGEGFSRPLHGHEDHCRIDGIGRRPFHLYRIARPPIRLKGLSL